MVNVRIPTPLRKFTNNEAEVSVDAESIQELIDALEKKFPGIRKRLCDDSGEIRKFINIYVGEDDIRFLQGVKTEITGKEVTIVPAIAGG